MSQPKNKAKRYFAAANGYRGFYSSFDNTFDPQSLTHMYILKGGPGTGKSTFMRKLSCLLQEKSAEVEEILCSSDQGSLDGVIAEKSDIRVAVIDGTAPHTCDPLLPGAFDDIINLGDAWDGAWLRMHRDKISSLCMHKRDAYHTAYSYLSIAGRADEYVKEIKVKSIDAKKLFHKAKSEAERFCNLPSGRATQRYITAFGRDGLLRLDTLKYACNETVSIAYDEHISGIYLREIYTNLCRLGVCAVHFPNALDHSLTDAVYLPDASVIYTTSPESPPWDIRISDVDRSRIRCATKLRDEALNEAKRHFGVASSIHFELEELYGQAMNFDTLDEIYSEKSAEIIKLMS